MSANAGDLSNDTRPLAEKREPGRATKDSGSPDAMWTATDKTLVIGLGNPVVSDDSVGLRVADSLESLLSGRSDVDVAKDYWGGLRLMERMIGYRSAVVIDAICTGAQPGTIHRLTTGMISTQKSASAHDVNLPTALAFGRAAGAPLPADQDVWLFGIEAQDVVNFGEHCTPAVESAIPRVVAEVTQLLNSLPRE